jgi:hypothetical protein
VGIKNFSSPIPSGKSASTSQASKNVDQVMKKRLTNDEEEASISTIEDRYPREVHNCASEMTYHVEALWKKYNKSNKMHALTICRHMHSQNINHSSKLYYPENNLTNLLFTQIL